MENTLLIILQAGDLTYILNPLLMVAMVGVFYFFIIRPQTQKAKAQQLFWSELKKGDKIVTSGGIYGEIIQLNEGTALIEVSKNTRMTIALTAISNEMTQVANAEKKA